MPALNRTALGKITCLTPACGHIVTVKEDINGRAYYTCSECSAQFFAKGPRADKLLRAELARLAVAIAPAAPAAKPAVPPAAPAKPAPAAAAKPAPSAPATPKPAPKGIWP